VKMTVNVNQARGRSFVAKFTYSGYAPVITNAPTSQTVGAGQNVTLKVGAGGATPLSYRWEFNQSDITGATNSSYTITNLQSAGAGWYSVVVSNAYGSVASPPMFLSVTMSLTNASGSIVSPPGLVDWWPADGNLLDIFGEVSGTPQSGFSFVPGESGQAFHFNGSAGCVVLGATNLPPPWTFCCWVNRQNAPGASAALIADGSYSLKLEQYNSTRQAGLTHLGVGDYFFSPPCTVPAGTWTHLAFVGTGTNVDLYLNGSLSGSISVANFPLPRSFIGAAEASGVKIDYLLGSLDEILVFNRALAGAEIGAIYSAGSAGLCRAPEFSGIGKDDAGNIQLNLRGQTGKSFTLYTSTNLLNWASAGVIENPVGVVQCTNSVDGQSQEFFRASQP
ncbi:MAG TPA: LamG-like jellyroll fold domain-containing protein, partial [Candidatus Binatia bacterium]|nr:LamG-like jellyroll fold domain-containing protein [Candidatus Binatia bacterium]